MTFGQMAVNCHKFVLVLAAAVFAENIVCPVGDCQQDDDIARIEAAEVTLFGQIRPTQPLTKRLHQLESAIWGRDYAWSTPESLSRIEAALSGQHPTTSNAASVPKQANSGTDAAVRAREIDDLLDEAMSKYLAGEKEGAQASFKKVLDLDPNNADANFNLGAIAEARHEYKSAEDYYGIALKANPNDPEIQQALTKIHKKAEFASNQQGNPAEQRDIQRLVLESSTAYKSGNYLAAIDCLLKVLAKSPKDASAEFALAQAYRAAGDLDSARFHMDRATILDPLNKDYKDSLIAIDKDLPSRSLRSKDTTVKTSSNGITPMQPEPGERFYRITHSGVGRVATLTITAAALGAMLGAGTGTPVGIAAGALIGGMAGLSTGIFRAF